MTVMDFVVNGVITRQHISDQTMMIDQYIPMSFEEHFLEACHEIYPTIKNEYH